MKGNHGLEALAALCGGASQASEEPGRDRQKAGISGNEFPNSSITSLTAVSLKDSTAIAIPAPVADHSQLSSQQWLQYLGSQPQNQVGAFTGVVPPFVTAPNAQTLQQMAFSIQGQYHGFMQAHATQMAQQYAQQQMQHQRSAGVNSNFMDPAAVAALAAKAFSQGQHPPTVTVQQAPPPESGAQQDTAASSPTDPPATKNPQRVTLTPFEVKIKLTNGNKIKSPPLARMLNLTSSELEESIDGATEMFETSSTVISTDKKEAKRAANRRSAQLSRKRKKHFIEELKEENDDLRRKEQILRSIPDLIVMFNSAGVLGFVSHSVSNFLDFKPSDLQGTSFWRRLCDESVCLLKAAFMDALAAKIFGMNTAPLGDGLWEVRLKNKDGAHKLVTLNGVVHFSGRHPECVCSVRPKEDTGLPPKQEISDGSAKSDGSEKAVFAGAFIKPEQSVINSVTDESSSGSSVKNMKKGARTGKRTAHISDGESMSESCSVRS